MSKRTMLPVLGAAGVIAGLVLPVLPSAAAPVQPRPIVCLDARPPALAPAARVSGNAAEVGTIRSTIGSGTPTTTVPNVMLVTPQPHTGALVVPTTTTAPSLPGVTLYAPEVLIPNRTAAGQNRSLTAADLIDSTTTTSSVSCY